MKIRNIIILATVILAFFAQLSVASAGQRFEYDLKWGFVLAGHSVMEHSDATKANPSMVESTTISADWMEGFYPVRNYVRSELNGTNTFYPSNYRITTLEGTYRKDREVRFELNEGKALYIDHLKGEEKNVEIPMKVYDPLSVLFKIKGMKLEVGKSIFVTIFDSKKVWNLEVLVLKKEKIKVPAGTFNTIKINPLMKSEGIFKRKGAMYLWISDDPRRIPVKVKSKVAVGSITALLTGGKY
jgi:hypothetical protein